MPEIESGTRSRQTAASSATACGGDSRVPIRLGTLSFLDTTHGPIRRKAAALICATLLGGALTFGPGVTLQRPSPDLNATTPFPAGIVLGLEYAQAHAESRRQKRIRERREARRKAAQARQKEADKKLLDNRIATLPASCAYDSYASFTSPTEIHVCGAYYYQPYEEDGIKGYEGYPIGADPEEVKRAKARRDKAREKRLAEAEKKLKAGRKTALSTDCSYDSFASFSAKSNVYTCGGVQFMQVVENGVAVFDRRGAGSVSAETKQVLARRAKAKAARQTEADKKSQTARRASLPAGCNYDSYASFFTASNIYTCAGTRYRQYTEAGAAGFEEIDL